MVKGRGPVFPQVRPRPRRRERVGKPAPHAFLTRLRSRWRAQRTSPASTSSPT